MELTTTDSATIRRSLRTGLLVLTHALLAGCASSGGTTDDSGGFAGDLPPGLESERAALESTETTVAGAEEEHRVDPKQAALVAIDPEEAKQRMADSDALANEELEGLKKAGWDYFVPLARSSVYTHHVVASNFNHICWLSGVAGRIKGSNYPSVRVGLNYFDSDYYTPGSDNPISAVKDNTEMEATVYCAARSHFSTPEGFVPYQEVYDYAFIWHNDSGIGCDKRLTATVDYMGNFAQMITGMGYDYNDKHDKFGINQSSSMSTKSSFWLEQQHSPCRSVGFVNPVRLRSNSLPRFTGPSGTGTAAQAGEFYWATTGGSFIGDTGLDYNTHGCYLSFIAGNFSSMNEWVRLQKDGGKWRLFVGAASDGGVRASVRCFPYAQ